KRTCRWTLTSTTGAMEGNDSGSLGRQAAASATASHATSFLTVGSHRGITDQRFGHDFFFDQAPGSSCGSIIAAVRLASSSSKPIAGHARSPGIVRELDVPGFVTNDLDACEAIRAHRDMRRHQGLLCKMIRDILRDSVEPHPYDSHRPTCVDDVR